ncbi:MAG: peptidoglycan DD-metalloendopeptidase family protein, partial [Candidatus Omnitrophica bacterium]|nr:peptidoglycan DD-metalloendopeptidase family protein [Candidatus Omnitrophota bacterium]
WSKIKEYQFKKHTKNLLLSFGVSILRIISIFSLKNILSLFNVKKLVIVFIALISLTGALSQVSCDSLYRENAAMYQQAYKELDLVNQYIMEILKSSYDDNYKAEALMDENKGYPRQAELIAQLSEQEANMALAGLRINLEKGDKNHNVPKLYKLLERLGFVPAKDNKGDQDSDNIFSDEMAEAIKEIQKKFGLEETGNWNAKNWHVETMIAVKNLLIEKQLALYHRQLLGNFGYKTEDNEGYNQEIDKNVFVYIENTERLIKRLQEDSKFPQEKQTAKWDEDTAQHYYKTIKGLVEARWMVQAADELLDKTTEGSESAKAQWNKLGAILPIGGREVSVVSEFGFILRPFGSDMNNIHTGIDIAAKTGTDVYAAAKGKVSFSGEKEGYGLTVIVDHGNGIQSLYAHLSQINNSIKAGKELISGTIIGKTGMTGDALIDAEEEHLHFEVLVNGQAVNPASLFLRQNREVENKIALSIKQQQDSQRQEAQQELIEQRKQLAIQRQQYLQEQAYNRLRQQLINNMSRRNVNQKEVSLVDALAVLMDDAKFEREYLAKNPEAAKAIKAFENRVKELDKKDFAKLLRMLKDNGVNLFTFAQKQEVSKEKDWVGGLGLSISTTLDKVLSKDKAKKISTELVLNYYKALFELENAKLAKQEEIKIAYLDLISAETLVRLYEGGAISKDLVQIGEGRYLITPNSLFEQWKAAQEKLQIARQNLESAAGLNAIPAIPEEVITKSIDELKSYLAGLSYMQLSDNQQPNDIDNYLGKKWASRISLNLGFRLQDIEGANPQGFALFTPSAGVGATLYDRENKLRNDATSKKAEGLKLQRDNLQARTEKFESNYKDMIEAVMNFGSDIETLRQYDTKVASFEEKVKAEAKAPQAAEAVETTTPAVVNDAAQQQDNNVTPAPSASNIPETKTEAAKQKQVQPEAPKPPEMPKQNQDKIKEFRNNKSDWVKKIDKIYAKKGKSEEEKKSEAETVVAEAQSYEQYFKIEGRDALYSEFNTDMGVIKGWAAIVNSLQQDWFKVYLAALLMGKDVKAPPATIQEADSYPVSIEEADQFLSRFEGYKNIDEVIAIVQPRIPQTKDAILKEAIQKAIQDNLSTFELHGFITELSNIELQLAAKHGVKVDLSYFVSLVTARLEIEALSKSDIAYKEYKVALEGLKTIIDTQLIAYKTIADYKNYLYTASNYQSSKERAETDSQKLALAQAEREVAVSKLSLPVEIRNRQELKELRVDYKSLIELLEQPENIESANLKPLMEQLQIRMLYQTVQAIKENKSPWVLQVSPNLITTAVMTGLPLANKLIGMLAGPNEEAVLEAVEKLVNELNNETSESKEEDKALTIQEEYIDAQMILDAQERSDNNEVSKARTANDIVALQLEAYSRGIELPQQVEHKDATGAQDAQQALSVDTRVSRDASVVSDVTFKYSNGTAIQFTSLVNSEGKFTEVRNTYSADGVRTYYVTSENTRGANTRFEISGDPNGKFNNSWESLKAVMNHNIPLDLMGRDEIILDSYLKMTKVNNEVSYSANIGTVYRLSLQDGNRLELPVYVIIDKDNNASYFVDFDYYSKKLSLNTGLQIIPVFEGDKVSRYEVSGLVGGNYIFRDRDDKYKGDVRVFWQDEGAGIYSHMMLNENWRMNLAFDRDWQAGVDNGQVGIERRVKNLYFVGVGLDFDYRDEGFEGSAANGFSSDSEDKYRVSPYAKLSVEEISGFPAFTAEAKFLGMDDINARAALTKKIGKNWATGLYSNAQVKDGEIQDANLTARISHRNGNISWGLNTKFGTGEGWESATGDLTIRNIGKSDVSLNAGILRDSVEPDKLIGSGVVSWIFRSAAGHSLNSRLYGQYRNEENSVYGLSVGLNFSGSAAYNGNFGSGLYNTYTANNRISGNSFANYAMTNCMSLAKGVNTVSINDAQAVLDGLDADNPVAAAAKANPEAVAALDELLSAGMGINLDLNNASHQKLFDELNRQQDLASYAKIADEVRAIKGKDLDLLDLNSEDWRALRNLLSATKKPASYKLQQFSKDINGRTKAREVRHIANRLDIEELEGALTKISASINTLGTYNSAAGTEFIEKAANNSQAAATIVATVNSTEDEVEDIAQALQADQQFMNFYFVEVFPTDNEDAYKFIYSKANYINDNYEGSNANEKLYGTNGYIQDLGKVIEVAGRLWQAYSSQGESFLAEWQTLFTQTQEPIYDIDHTQMWVYEDTYVVILYDITGDVNWPTIQQSFIGSISKAVDLYNYIYEHRYDDGLNVPSAFGRIFDVQIENTPASDEDLRGWLFNIVGDNNSAPNTYENALGIEGSVYKGYGDDSEKQKLIDNTVAADELFHNTLRANYKAKDAIREIFGVSNFDPLDDEDSDEIGTQNLYRTFLFAIVSGEDWSDNKDKFVPSLIAEKWMLDNLSEYESLIYHIVDEDYEGVNTSETFFDNLGIPGFGVLATDILFSKYQDKDTGLWEYYWIYDEDANDFPTENLNKFKLNLQIVSWLCENLTSEQKDLLIDVLDVSGLALEEESLDMNYFQALLNDVVWSAKLNESGAFQEWNLLGGTYNSPEYSTQKLNIFQNNLQEVVDLKAGLNSKGLASFFNDIYSGIYSDSEGVIDINIDNLDTRSYEAIISNIIHARSEYNWGVYEYEGAYKYAEALEDLKLFMDTIKADNVLTESYEAVYGIDLSQKLDADALEFVSGQVGNPELDMNSFFEALPAAAVAVEGLNNDVISRQKFEEYYSYYNVSLRGEVSLGQQTIDTYGYNYVTNLSDAIFDLAFKMNYLTQRIDELGAAFNREDFMQAYGLSRLEEPLSLTLDTNWQELAPVLFMVATSVDDISNPFDFDIDKYNDSLPYLAELMKSVATRPEFVQALNYFYKVGIDGSFNLNPINEKRYGADRFERIGQFFFNVADNTGDGLNSSDEQKAYPDIETYVEIVVKMYELRGEISARLARMNYNFNFDSDSIGFGYMARGGVITLFLYDGMVSLPSGLKQVTIAPLAVTLTAGNQTLKEARSSWSQDSQLIKQADTIVNMSTLEGADLSGFYSENAIGRVTGYFTPQGRKLWEEKDYYSVNTEDAGKLLRQVRGNRETVYSYENDYSYFDSRQFSLIPVPSAGKTYIYGTGILLSDFDNTYIDGEEYVSKEVRYYDAAGRVARTEEQTLGLISGATHMTAQMDESGEAFRYVKSEFKDGAHELLNIATSYGVADFDMNGRAAADANLKYFELKGFSELGGAVYEGRNNTLEADVREETDNLGRPYRQLITKSDANRSKLITYNYDDDYFGAFDKATTTNVYLSDAEGNAIKKLFATELIKDRAFNEFGGADYLETNYIDSVKRVISYDGFGREKAIYEGDNLYVIGAYIEAESVIYNSYDEKYWSARDIAGVAEKYSWNSAMQEKDKLITRTEPKERKLITTYFGYTANTLVMTEHKSGTESDRDLYIDLFTGKPIRIEANGRRIADINYNEMGAEESSIKYYQIDEKTGEAALSVSADESDIYNYNPQTYELGNDVVAHVKKVGEITLQDGSTALVFKRTNIAQETIDKFGEERIFGIKKGEEDECLRYYPKAAEAELIINDTESYIYKYNPETYELEGEPVAVSRFIKDITINGTEYSLISRVNISQESIEKLGNERVFGVIKNTGAEALRYYPEAKEVEVIISETASDIYTYNPDYTLGDKVAHVETVNTITSPKDEKIIVLHRTGKNDRVYGVNASTGEEVLRYYSDEAELITSKATSDIYTYNPKTYELINKTANTKIVNSFTLKPTGADVNVIERTGKNPRVYAVNTATGEEAVRYYPKEAEVIISETESHIYRYTPNYETKGEPIATVSRRTGFNFNGRHYIVLERKGQDARFFGVVKGDREEALRYYPRDPKHPEEGGEIEVVTGKNSANIYNYNSNFRPVENKPIAQIKAISKISLEGKVSVILQRTGDSPRIYGIDALTGKESAQFYYQPQVINGVKVQGIAVVDRGETTSILSKGNKVMPSRYSGKEALKNICYYNSEYKPVITDKVGQIGYAVNTDDKIKGYEGLQVVEEITMDYNFKIARAVDAFGLERAVISMIPGDGYSVDIIEYNNSQESGRVTYRAERKNGLYKIGERISTLLVLQGEELQEALNSYNQIVNSLSKSRKAEFNAVINNLRATLNCGDIYAARLTKEKDGTYIVYRIKGDYSARVIFQRNT